MAMRTRQTKDRRIRNELLDELPAGEGAAEAFRSGELPSEMRKALAERVLDAEKGNRATQTDFRCLECGHAGNADVNAARNSLTCGNGASGWREALALAASVTRQLHSLRLAA